MKREDWDRIGSLFEEALERNGAEREAFLSGLGDEELEGELRSLLVAHEGRGPFDVLGDAVTGPEFQRLFHLDPGEALGPYRIVHEIATGGMATVYLAEDLKNERHVAIKVLRPEFAAGLGADRFIWEMKTTAKLQHPKILPLFDSGQADGFLYYVMPFIEGETLRDKLNRETQLEIEEAIRIATEVAEALDCAHRHNVIHRDIKPDNILLQDGHALVADFGIALAVSAAAGERTTGTGLSLGTPHYMSPEQATAEKDLTLRTDIYSLGCVLYEMLTGELPHTGSTAQQTIQKIVTDEVRPVTELRKTVPLNVAAATAKSLEKLPADRFETARAFADALADPTFTTPAHEVLSRIARASARWRRLAVGLAAVAVAAVVAGVWGWLRPVALEIDPPVVEFTLDPPDSGMVFGHELALSPDGRRLVAEVFTDEGRALYQRMLDSRDWRIIPGTEGGDSPFFSPDGKWLGFLSTAEKAIKRVPLEGGPAQIIVQAPSIGSTFGGVSWGPDNTVVFTNPTPTTDRAELFRVPVYGGVPERLTTVDSTLRELVHLRPHHLQNGSVLLFTAMNTHAESFITALSLESGKVSRLARGTQPQSHHDDRVVYATPQGLIVARRLDPRTLTLKGSLRQLADGVTRSYGVATYTVSYDGTLAYLSGITQRQQLLLVSREGETRELFSSGAGSGLGVPRFSPSGDRIAFSERRG